MGEERGQRELESKIAEWVRTYVVAAHGEDSSQEQEALRWLCSGLEWLLQRRLEGREGTEGGGLMALVRQRTCYRTPSR
jgi:hypothetical protein